MKVNTRKILGWICFIYSGFVLFLQLFIIVMQVNLKIYVTSWIFHIESIGLGVWFGALGFQLVREERESNRWRRLIIYAIILFPIIILRGVESVEHLKLGSDWLPYISAILVLFSVISICVPYLFGGYILKRVEERKSRSDATPPQILHLIGMLFSVTPSTLAFWFYLLGSSKDTAYYLVGISYLAIGVWWAWWHHRYSKAPILI